MEGIKYSQDVMIAEFDKEAVIESRTIPFVIAAEDTGGRKHRNRFNYNWDNWNLESFNSNPIVGYQHNVYGDNMCLPPNPDDVIAKATARMGEYKGKRAIVAEATFEPASINPTAEKVFQKLIFGSLKATSTGILPTGKTSTEFFKNSKGEVEDYQINFPGQELVEFSIVNIPADPQALRRSMKSHTMAALNFVQRVLPELSMADLSGMKVQEILDMIERRAPSQIELFGPDPNVSVYKTMLEQIKKRK